MESDRYNLFVATLDRSGVLLDDIYRLGVEQVAEFRLNSFYDRQALCQVRSFAQYLGKHQIDIVHTHDFYTNIFGMAGASLASVPVRIASRRESAVRPQSHRLVERCAYRFAHAVVANCEEVRQQLLEEGLASEKVHTVYNGLDPARVETLQSDREILETFKLPANVRFVTITANMRAHIWKPEPACHKDHPTFLQAAQQISQKVPDAAFIIAGEGELKEATQDLAKDLGIGNRTFFVGRCQNIGALLSISDVCVLSSSSEGFSNSILEYMAAGRPVVATDVGGAKEAIIPGETGYLVKAGDHAKIAHHVISLLSDPKTAQRIGSNGRQLVTQKFSCQRQLQTVENLYDELLTLRIPNWASGLSREVRIKGLAKDLSDKSWREKQHTRGLEF